MNAEHSTRHQQRRAADEPSLQSVRIPIDGVTLEGELIVPEEAKGVVLFAHGSGSSRHSPRNQFVARVLRCHESATLLFDLLTEAEEVEDAYTAYLRFDITLLAKRLKGATRWASQFPATKRLRLGYFGSSTGAAAALIAAASLDSMIDAVVSRGGRADLAMDALPCVTAATLLIVGERDELVMSLNEQACARLRCKKRLATVPGATHLFEEPGALEQVARLAAEWFEHHWKPGGIAGRRDAVI